MKRQGKKYPFIFLLLISIFFTSFFAVPTGEAATGINRQINFQGKVVNTDGTNVTTASYTFLFCAYTTASPATACTTGANNDAVWRESKSVTVTDGVFQTNLGDTTVFAALIDFNTDNIYLGINFNANGQMTPLVRFTAAPYALNALKVGGLTVTDTTGTLTIPNGKTISFADTFTTAGAFATTLTSTAATSVTLPTTGTLATIAGSETFTNKIIGSTGLSFSGATTDITTATNEDLTILANGTGIISLNDATTITGTALINSTGTAATTIGNGTGALTLRGVTSLDNTFTVTGSNLTTLGGNLTVTGTAWTATPTISGLITATSGLTASGVLTAGGGISLSASQSLAAAALSYVDLGLITHSTVANQGLRLPNAASASPSSPTTGEGYLAWDAAGNQLITYNGSAWSTLSGGGYNLIKDETVSLTARTTLAFLGAGVSCVDNATQTDCTIGGGSGSDLQGTYGTDADGSDAIISLTAADGSLIFRNPASGGSASGYAVKIDQLATGAVDGLQINNAGTGSGLSVDATGTGNLAVFKNNGTEKITFSNNGSITVSGADSSIVRGKTTDFALGTVGSNLSNTSDRVEMIDGTPANSGQGTITTASQPVVSGSIGAGAMSITRPDGKYFVIHGGAVLTTSVYDPVASTFAAGNAVITTTSTGLGAGALLLPRANGMYVLILGIAAAPTTATSNIDPSGSTANTTGPTLATAITGAGTVAFKRPDGKYLVTIGASTPGVATNIYDPVANTFAAGPAATGFGNWGAGVLAIPRPDGTALMVSGGAASTTAIYNPYAVSATIGTFSGAGPKLDGVRAAGTCGINGIGSVAIKRQDGRFIILSKASVSAMYDPVANTMTCTTGVANVSALGDGAHAIPIQNGKVLIFAGGNTTTAFVYNQDSDTFSAYAGTAPTAITTGAHSILRLNGTWQVLVGGGTATNNFSTNLPMSDPFPSQVSAGTPTVGAGCTTGTHSYYVTFIGTGSVESELSNKSNIVSCTAANGTVALTTIPAGPFGTTARKVYRTLAGDVGTPQLLTTLADNTTVIYNDTTADGSLGAAYSVTAATTWYTSEDISNAYLSDSSTLRWNAQLEAVYAGNRNGSVNTAFKVMQFYVKTAVNSSGCATPLANASWQEIQNSGDLIRRVSGANCVKISVHFNRAMPKRLSDDRGTWTGNNSTVLRYDYVTPTLFSVSIDNSTVLKRYAFDFASPNSNSLNNGTVPAAPTSAAPAGSGSCTSGAHFWFVTFVTNGAESQLSPASTTQTCSGTNIETLNPIPLGPSGTTARKIYRTKAADLVTDTPFLVATVSDNSTTTYADSLADSSLGAAFSSTSASGPTLSRGESSRVEMVNNQLTLPWGRLTPTTATTVSATVGLTYMGAFGSNHPLLNNLAGLGTMVLARDDKTFLIIEGSNGAATADLYDPATQTFDNQVGAGNIPTAAVASGGFAIKRPNGNFLVVHGGATLTTSNYNQYAPSGSRFTVGPALLGTAISQGAFAIQNADGTYTILPGNAATTTTIYDPVRNTMTVGPLQTTGTNLGGLAIPLIGANNNIYKVVLGTTLAGAIATGTMNYNANTKTFTLGQVLTVGVGAGAYAFQRADGYWVLVKGDATTGTVLGTLTAIINPYNGTDVAGPTITASAGRGSHVIPRADGTFLLVGGNLANGTSALTQIYTPWGGASNVVGTFTGGTGVAGPALLLPGTGTIPALPTAGTPTAGGSCTAGVHFWKYSHVTQGVESPLSVVSATQTCVTTTGQTVPLSVVTVGPTGTTARRIYRTLAGAAATAPYYLVGTIADNTTTTYSDTNADPAATNPYNGGGVGDGGLSFQRPDGKWITLFGGSTPSKTVNIYDAGWYSDGQYMSEQMNVPAMSANSTLDWQQTPDQFVRMEARSAASQSALSVAGSNIVSKPGGSIGNAASDTWVQVTVNFRREFPTFPGNLNGVYNSSGGMSYGHRQISLPTVNMFQITNGMDLMTLQNNGLNMLRVTSNGNIMSSAGGGFFSGGADLAENYTSTQALDKGEVVMIDRTNPEGVVRSTGQYETSVLGVVSTAPGFVAGGYTQDAYPIALVGRVPIRISTENGPIRTGDFLTAASIPGYAMRATQAGRVLGRALEDFDETTATQCPSQGLGNSPATRCGSVMMFVNLTDYFGMPMDIVLAEQNANQENAEGVSVSTMESGSPEESGFASNSPIRLAMSAPSKEEATLAYLIKLRDERLAGSASPASEIFTDRISASTSITTPTLVVDKIFAKSIKADSIEGLKIFTDQLTSLSEKYAGLEATAAVFSEDGTVVAGTEQKALETTLKDLAADTIMIQLDGSILGKLTVAGALRIGGDAEFGGDTIFSRLSTFVGNTLFRGKVLFEKTPTFGSDVAGFAVIAEGQRSVDIVFDEEYLKQPIVSVSVTSDQSPLAGDAAGDNQLAQDVAEIEADFNTAYFDSDIKYIVTKKSGRGFTITLSKQAPREMQFSWVALAVSDAKTSRSKKDGAPIIPKKDESSIVPPREIPVSIPSVIPSALDTPTPSSVPESPLSSESSADTSASPTN